MTTRLPRRPAAVAAALIAAPLCAQGLPIPLNYNFNGIVHAGESGQPDAPAGYRSISDRGLDFSAGIPADPLLQQYQLVSVPGALDIVHLGNRNTVDNGNWMFDLVPDGDNIGIQPTWLPVVDQSTPQTSVLNPPVAIGSPTTISFLYQISNGGGSFDVTFTFASTNTFTATLTGGDWFGGVYPGTALVDSGIIGNNLSITEGIVDLSAFSGDAVTQISFSNRSNLTAGYAILAANVNYPAAPRRLNQIALNYNFNGIVHAGESAQPDAPAGYRSISDRGLDFSAGVPAAALLSPYSIVAAPGVLDIVHVGNRNTVDSGLRPFDLVPDGDDFGIQPTWLPNPDQTGPQTTTLALPILLDNASSAAFLFQISNGGGSFDVTFGFQGGGSTTASLSGGDWFGGTFPGTAFTDNGLPNNNLSITERTVDLSSSAGQILTSITFGNRSNTNAGYAILAANVSGCIACANAGGTANLAGGNGPIMSSISTGNLGCPIDWNVTGATPGTFGFFGLSVATQPIPLLLLAPTCTGTIHIVSPALTLVGVNPTGTASLSLPLPPNLRFCGATVTAQYAEFVTASCPIRLSNAISVTVGN